MPIPVLSDLNFTGGARITGIPAASANGQPMPYEQVLNLVNNLNWKDDVRVASTANVNIASPGATIDTIALANGDRVLLKDQSTASQNGIYIWTGSAVALTRSLDADDYNKLESAIVMVNEGTANGNTRWRQTGVNGTIGSTAVTWAPDGNSAPSATETTQGIAEIATQAETDTGTDDARIVTPLKLRNSSFAKLAVSQAIGDGSATTYSITHGFGTFDVSVSVREATGARRAVVVETDTPDNNTARVLFVSAPALNAYRVTVSKL